METGVQERQPTGWTVFAGMVLVIVGFLDALWGLAGSSTTRWSWSAVRE